MNKENLFDKFRKDQISAGLETSTENSLICPLCWIDTKYENLTIEHVVPSSLRGSRTVLTCKRCNNKHGSVLDAHLVKYAKAKEALTGEGHEVIKAELIANENRVAVNWKKQDTNHQLVMVKHASNPASCGAMIQDFSADRVSKFRMNSNLGFAFNNCQTAVLRSAYLIMFLHLGYGYAKNNVVQVIRNRICNITMSEPRIDSLVGEIADGDFPEDSQYWFCRTLTDGIEFRLVIIRAKVRKATFFVARMPAPNVNESRFFSAMENHAKEFGGKSVPFKLFHEP